MLKHTLVKNILFFMALALILFGIYATFTLSATRGTVIIGAGLGIMVITQFDWSEIKILGLEAKLRDTISDAENVLDSLRKVSIPISEVAISLASRTGRMDTATSNKDLFNLVTSISNELKKINVSDKELDEIKKDWYYFTTFDMCSILLEEAKTILKTHHDKLEQQYRLWVSNKPISDHVTNQKMIEQVEHAKKELQYLRNLLWKKPYYDMPFILRRAIDKSSVITAKEKESFWKSNDELWKDIIFYIEHKNFRRPQLWLSK
ncbi:hypothetical protein ACTLKO_000252 [Enterobacter ludwigii]|uniref:hypothetical protein n=2 Tax=Enterobacter ludwigii TaxID=299767 RepID=UPI002737C59E|nr:hypothetical protein [Enterobacter ludwigii]MDW5475423.1 hypothetical protein [Enterobacter ludwigii]WLK79244.1 hypothetical protein Q8W08_14840 [Enterobacter ludwigii]